MKGWITALALLGTLTACVRPQTGGLSSPFATDPVDRGICRQAQLRYKAKSFLQAADLFEQGGTCIAPEAYPASLRPIGRGEQAAELRLEELLTPTDPPRTDREQAEIWLQIGQDYRSVGHYDQAWEAAQMGLSLAPSKESLSVLLAQIALDLGQLGTAEANLAGLHTGSSNYLLAQSRLLHAQGELDRALDVLLLVPKPGRPGVTALRTQLLLEKGQIKRASVDLRGQLYSRYSNNHVVLLARRVAFLMQIGKRQQAKESWFRLQSMAPGAPLYPMAVPVRRSANPWPR